MTRGQGVVLIVGLTLMGLSIGGAPFLGPRHAVAFVLPFACVLATVGILVLWFGFQALRSAAIRRNGRTVVGRVIHAKSAGAVNRVPNYMVEVELPNGTTAKLQVRRWRSFFPGEPLTVMVSDNYPGWAALPRVNRDF